MSRYFLFSVAVFVMAIMPATAETVTFQNGVDGYTGCQDTEVHGYYPDNNYGNWGYLWSGDGYYNEGLAFVMRYDVSSLTGVYSSIDSLMLRLYLFNANISEAITAAPMVAENQYWGEGTGVASGGGVPMAILNGTACVNYQQYNTLEWAGGHTGGGSADDVYWRNTNPPITGTPYTWIEISIDPATADANYGTGGINTLTGLIDEWISEGATNAGLYIGYSDCTKYDFWKFASSECVFDHYPLGSPDFHPQLVIEYTPIPEPSTLTLLGCGLIGLLAYAWEKYR